MLTRPIVALITPTFNNGHLLNRLYKSIKSQTYKKFCWIVIDDGSTDSTKSIVKGFKGLEIIYFRQKNSGPNSARNRAVKLMPTTCKYIIDIDSDDTFYHAKTLEFMVKDVESSKKNIGMIGYSSVDGISGKRSSFTQKPEIVIDFKESLKGKKIKGEFIFIQKREILKISKWPEKIWGYEGIRHWEINKYYDFLYKEKLGRIYYRDRKENLTSPEGTILRSNNMVDGIDYLLKKHGENLKIFARDQYIYFNFTKSIYLLLSNKKFEFLKNTIFLFKLRKSFKMHILCLFLFLCIIPPNLFIKKMYILIKRINYNYKK